MTADDAQSGHVPLIARPLVYATRLALPARVVRCNQDLSPEYFNIGVEFEIVTDDQKNIIEAVIENYEFRRQHPNYPPRPTSL